MSLKPWVESDKRRKTFVVRWRDPLSKEKQRDDYIYDSKKAANTRRDIIESRLRDGSLGITAPITLQDASEIFIKNHVLKLRTQNSRANGRTVFGQINAILGNRYLHQLNYLVIVSYWETIIKRGCAVSTANKHLMWIHNLYERFKKWNEMIPEVYEQKVTLPPINPVDLARENLGRARISTRHLKRKRTPSTEELRKVKSWCTEHDPDLWKLMERAITTSLRKSDMLSVSGKVEGVQSKTGMPFGLPIAFEEVILTGGLRYRWNSLRGYMGWLPFPKGGPKNKLHTTWHDLRHLGATIPKELGYPNELIKAITGHGSDRQLSDYMNIREEAIKPVLDSVSAMLKAL